jgi:glutamate synthase domain-containing protein 1
MLNQAAIDVFGREGSLYDPSLDHDACGTGFIARLGAAPSYDIVQFALTALERLTHRGGVDADGASGDGAGLLASLPKPFFRARAAEQGIELPEQFGLGFAFFPTDSAAAGGICMFSKPRLARMVVGGLPACSW